MMKEAILSGNTSLGIELGSTRIKAVLIGSGGVPIASGSHDWENRLENGIWTYHLDDVWAGMRECYAGLCRDVKEKYGVELETVGSLGVSGMMHGYLVFGAGGIQLVPFRTWRNTITAEASEKLVPAFCYPIPHRWSIAHLYQAVLNKEPHLPQIDFMTTLAGYVHWKLTGVKAVGVGEASGMFPIDLETKDFNQKMIRKFEELIQDEAYPWKLPDILPRVLQAGEPAGFLTEEGAKLLDPSGALKAGIACCPPEGDAGTGMAATNSVAPNTGNVSAGTSIFLMAVLPRDLEKVHPEIDLVTTPSGDLVAMVHCNNCTGDIDAWAKIFMEFSESAGFSISKPKLYDTLYNKATEADRDGGGLLSFNYLSGESITGLSEGRPLFARLPGSSFTLANFMRTELYSALATLKIGCDILEREEGVKLTRLYGHGGFFKTEKVGQRMMAAAVEAPVTVMETAGEGGPWGMALLASYMKNREPGETLGAYLETKIFGGAKELTISPDQEDVAGFQTFMRRYKAGLAVEKSAVETISE